MDETTRKEEEKQAVETSNGKAIISSAARKLDAQKKGPKSTKGTDMDCGKVGWVPSPRDVIKSRIFLFVALMV